MNRDRQAPPKSYGLLAVRVAKLERANERKDWWSFLAFLISLAAFALAAWALAKTKT